MAFITPHFFLPVFLIILVLSSGCIHPGQQENLTRCLTGTQVIPAEVSLSQIPSTSPAPTTTSYKEPEDRPVRKALNVLRGEPFSVNGTVRDLRIKEIQVWMLNDTYRVWRLPVAADGSFRVDLMPEDTATLSRTFSSALVIQYPSPRDQFAVNLDEKTGNVTASVTLPERILSELNAKKYYPSTLADYLDQAITGSGSGNTCDIYFLNGVDAWIEIDPIPRNTPGTMTVTGTTSLPPGTPLSVTVVTMFTHPSPKNYDFSHEIASGDGAIVPGVGGSNRFSGTTDTSRLNTGKYLVVVESGDGDLQANANTEAEIVAAIPSQTGSGNYINWSALPLPPLAVNESMQPVMLEGEWKIVPPGTEGHNNEVPYGTIIDCAPDGICRVFDPSGIQFLAVYNANEARMVGVPNGAAIDHGGVGNVTRVSLGGTVILTKINEQET